MIKPNELRIGNIVLVQGKPVKITGIIHDNIYFGSEFYVRVRLHQSEPIPLTPEILEKCGFKLDVEVYEQAGFYPCIIKNKMNEGWRMDFGEYVTNELNYLHQLQNLYFALTGTELEINIA